MYICYTNCKSNQIGTKVLLHDEIEQLAISSWEKKVPLQRTDQMTKKRERKKQVAKFFTQIVGPAKAYAIAVHGSNTT